METDKEVDAIVDDYLDDLQFARRKVCDRIAEVVRNEPMAKDEVLYILARGAGSSLAQEVAKELRTRLEKAEAREARADLFRRYEVVMHE